MRMGQPWREIPVGCLGPTMKSRGLRSKRPTNPRPAKGPMGAQRRLPTAGVSTIVKRPNRPKSRTPWNERASFVLYAEEQIARSKRRGPQKVVTRIVCHHLESGRQRSWRLTSLDQLPAWIVRMLKPDRVNRPDESSPLI